MTLKSRHVWLFLASVGIALAIATASLLSISALPLAVAATDTAAELRELSGVQFDDLDESGLGGLQDRMAAVESDVKAVAAAARWAAPLSPALAWLRGVDREAYAWAVQVARLENDLEVASELLSVSSQLIDAYRQAEDGLVNVRTTGPVAELTSRAAELRDAFGEAEQALTRTSRFDRNEPAVYLPRELVGIGEGLRPLVAQFTGDGAAEEPLAFDALKSTLVELDDAVRTATALSHTLAGTVAEGAAGGTLAARLEVLGDLLTVIQGVSTATQAGLKVVEPLMGGGNDAGGIFGGEGAAVAALDQAAGQVDDLAQAVSLLEDGRRTLKDIEERGGEFGGTSSLPELSRVLDLLHGGLRVVMDIAPIGGELVGASGARRYLVLGQSSDELRATGGFVSALWLVTLENGRVEDVRYHDTVRVDDWDRLELYPPAPQGLEDHMNASVWLLRDVSWQPDFPTVALTAADMYKIGQRQDVDGVVAMNQWALQSILQGLGSVDAPGGETEITQRNLFSKLEEGSDQHGRAYVDLALQGILDRLSEPLSLAEVIKVVSAIHDSLESRDLLIYADDPKVQSVLNKSGWDGRLRDDGADYLYIVDSNVGWSKADRNIERQVRYEIDMRRESGARTSLTLSYNNHSGPGSPGCEPQWLNRGTNYSQLKNACYWDFWRVYTPKGTKLLGHTPLTLPEYSVSVEIGRARPGDDTVRVSSSYNRTVLSGLFALGAGEANEFNLVYDLPPGVVNRSGETIEYELLVQKQPGSRSRALSVELILPEGYELAVSSHGPAFAGDSRVGFELNIERDTLLKVTLTREDDGSN